MATLRTKEMNEKYSLHRRSLPPNAPCPLCEQVAIQEFLFWKIINNNFPYDLIAKEHHMLVPKRHVTEEGLTEEEAAEMNEIKKSAIHPTYEWIIEATPAMKSIPEHFHLHLVIGKLE